MKKSILFFGELFPNTIHGIAMSNSRVVAILEKEFKIFVVEENSKLEEHNKLGILKAIKKLNIIFKATYYSIISRFNYFYSPFFNSTFGSLKLLPIVLIFKLFNPKAKIILHLHGNLHYSFLQKWYNVFIAKLLFKLANNVICLCPTQVKDMEQTFPTIHYFNFLYNTVFEPYNEIKAPIKSVDYIFISNYLVSKGIFDLLEAIKTTEMSLVTHGRFANDDIKTKIESYGKKNKNLSINNSIKAEAKFKAISEAKCLVLPSWNEGFPTVLLEAMACGTPVISTNVGYVNDMLGNVYPFLVPPNDINALHKALINFHNSDQKVYWANYLKERYDQNFNSLVHQKQLLNFFK